MLKCEVAQKNNFFVCVKNTAENFVYSLFFPVILGLLTLLFWIANLPNVGLLIVCLSATFILVFFEDLTPAFPPLLLLGMTFRDSQSLSQNPLALVLITIFTLSIVFNLIKYPFKKVKFDLISFSLCILLLVMLLSEVFSPNKQAISSGIPFITTAGFSALIVHFLTINRIKDCKKHNRVKIFCYYFLFAINVACLEMLYAILHENFIDPGVFEIPGGFGWANTGHVANLVLLAVPVCFYLITKTKNVLPLLVELVFLYISCFASQSDGCLAILILFTPVFILKTQFDIMPKNKSLFKLFWVNSILVCGALLCFFIYFYPLETERFFNKMMSDSNRAPIYQKGWEIFISFPIIGAGVGNAAATLDPAQNGLFHSTIIQSLASCGVVGLGSVAFLYYARIKSLCKMNNSLSSFMIVCAVMFFCYGLIDNSEVNIVVIYFTALVGFTLTQNKKAENEWPLPVYKKLNSLS